MCKFHFEKLCFLSHSVFLSLSSKRKLPGTPLLLVVPSGPTTSICSGTSSKRARFWHNHLSVLGKVVPVTMHTSNGGSGVSISQCLDHIIGAVRMKVLEVWKIFNWMVHWLVFHCWWCWLECEDPIAIKVTHAFRDLSEPMFSWTVWRVWWDSLQTLLLVHIAQAIMFTYKGKETLVLKM